MARIGVNDLDVVETRDDIAQYLDHTVVDFDGDDVCARLGECKRERTEPCSNLDDEVTGANGA